MAHYTSVTLLKQTVPMVGSVTTVTSADFAQFIRAAESLVHGKLAKTYTLPVSPVPPLLETLATDLALYRLLALRFFTQEQMNESVWPDRFKEAMGTLDKVASGEVILVSSAGEVIASAVGEAQFRSTTLGKEQTMSEDEFTRSIVDSEKITDLRAARDIW